MKSYSYTELAELTGEILPERAVLSTLLVGGGNGGGHSIVPNCATNVVNQSGSLGQLLLAGPNTATVACSGATVG